MQRAGLSSWRDSLQLKRLRRSVLDSTNEPRSIFSVTGWESRSCSEGPRGRIPPEGWLVRGLERLASAEGRRDSPAQRGPRQRKRESLQGLVILSWGHGVPGKVKWKTRMKFSRKKKNDTTHTASYFPSSHFWGTS